MFFSSPAPISAYPLPHNCVHIVSGGCRERLTDDHRFDISASACLCAGQALAQAVDSPCSITKYHLSRALPRPIVLQASHGLLVLCLLEHGSALLPTAIPPEAQRTALVTSSPLGPLVPVTPVCSEILGAFAHAFHQHFPGAAPAYPSHCCTAFRSQLSSLLEVPLGGGWEEKQEVTMQLPRKPGYMCVGGPPHVCTVCVQCTVCTVCGDDLAAVAAAERDTGAGDSKAFDAFLAAGRVDCDKDH